MNFMFSWQEQYLTRSLRSLVRYCSCHSNIKFISSRYRVISSISLIFTIEVLAMYCLGCLVWTRRAPMAAILFQMKHPKSVFGRWRVPVKFTEKNDVFFGLKIFRVLWETPESRFGSFTGRFSGPRSFRVFWETHAWCELLYVISSEGCTQKTQHPDTWTGKNCHSVFIRYYSHLSFRHVEPCSMTGHMSHI